MHLTLVSLAGKAINSEDTTVSLQSEGNTKKMDGGGKP